MQDPNPPPDPPGLVSAAANQVIGALTEPRSFLLFILAVMGLVEYSSYLKTQMLVTTMVNVVQTSAATISREQDFNKEIVGGLLRIIDTGVTNALRREEMRVGQELRDPPPDPVGNDGPPR